MFYGAHEILFSNVVRLGLDFKKTCGVKKACSEDVINLCNR
ncbi:Hypothetical protein ETEE_0194 [Edwardsiella anguillarum ET080813]|uniref:Uncharacterized protein n=1 Tax=Edwardsiella anguillarum ET080813 TaxID=667120 RepID=A0A076LIF3_9GAMM|nr:Hypothetical protein ETEE_0194 [Edwardsiella anguillarum ET080813]